MYGGHPPVWVRSAALSHGRKGPQVWLRLPDPDVSSTYAWCVIGLHLPEDSAILTYEERKAWNRMQEELYRSSCIVGHMSFSACHVAERSPSNAVQ